MWADCENLPFFNVRIQKLQKLPVALLNVKVPWVQFEVIQIVLPEFPERNFRNHISSLSLKFLSEEFRIIKVWALLSSLVIIVSIFKNRRLPNKPLYDSSNLIPSLVQWWICESHWICLVKAFIFWNFNLIFWASDPSVIIIRYHLYDFCILNSLKNSHPSLLGCIFQISHSEFHFLHLSSHLECWGL